MTDIIVRDAGPEDAEGMCKLINAIIEIGGTTAHSRPFTVDRMIAHHITGEGVISCKVACESDVILGFQYLAHADPNTQMPQDWGIIASFVDPAAQGKGVGGLLFSQTKIAAQNAGIVAIDATIRLENTPGRKYYSRLGFVDYARTSEAISKKYLL